MPVYCSCNNNSYLFSLYRENVPFAKATGEGKDLCMYWASYNSSLSVVVFLNFIFTEFQHVISFKTIIVMNA